MKKYAIFFLLLSIGYSQTIDTDVLKKWQQPAGESCSVYNAFCQRAQTLTQARKTRTDAIMAASDFLQYQSLLRQQLQHVVGEFPERTPLQSRVTGVVHKPDYRLEKVLFQSMPGNYVTAALYIPEKRAGKSPAVLYCSGHTTNGFRSDAYQIAILNLVSKGFIVLAIDPVGQGERMQYYDPVTAKSLIGGPTAEHSYVGAQCFLAGYSPALYWIWDGVRAVDYLVSRKEVDPQRIGITGRSGGGTQSAYIAAIDERIVAAAPECYLTNFARLFQSVGPQDAEQNFLHGLACGIDQADLLLMRAPRPALMITTTADMFSIQGARETYGEVSRFYHMLGRAQDMQMVEDDTVHASTRKNREAMYGFFQKYLHLPGDNTEQAIPLLTVQELQVLPEGQTALLADHKTVFVLNRQRAERIVAQVAAARKENVSQYLSSVRGKAIDLSGYSAELNHTELVFTGRTRYLDLMVEKYFIKEPRLLTPFLLVRRQIFSHQEQPLVFLLHSQGKSLFNQRPELVRSLVDRDYMVMLPDLAGCGESAIGLAPGDSWNFSIGRAPFNLLFAGIQVKSSLLGLAARQISLLAAYMRRDKGAGEISAVAFGALGPVLLHAAAFDANLQRIGLCDSPISYADMVMNTYYQPEYMMYSVAAALPVYDLQDLAACLSPRKLVVANARNSMAVALTENEVKNAWSFAQDVYQSKGHSESLQFFIGDIKQLIDEW